MNRLTIHVSLIYIETISAGILLWNGLTETLANSVMSTLICLLLFSRSRVGMTRSLRAYGGCLGVERR